MNRHIPAALSALAAFALLLPAQEQPEKPAHPDVRLTYELPVDTLQRQLQQNPDQDLEQVLASIVRTMQTRLGSFGTVTRHEATGFRIDVPAATPSILARIERRVAIAGRLEMWIVADRTYDDADLQLDAERKHLRAWLADGNLERVQAKPRAIADMPRRPKSQVRWVPRLIRPGRTGEATLWKYPLSMIPQFEGSVVPLYDAADWNGGTVPADQQGPDAHLVELVPINLHAAAFSDRDLDSEGVSLGVGRNGNPVVNYTIVRERRRDYADWSSRFHGSASAIVLDGMLVTAPTFRGRIPGRGIIEGNFTKAEAEDLVDVLRFKRLPAPPMLKSKIERSR